MATVDEPYYLLAIESAIAGGSIALFKDDYIVCGASGGNFVSRAEDLLPRIIDLLGDAGITVGQLKRVAVSLGPGSYTGLRIGIATVMGLCRGQSRSLQGPRSFGQVRWTRDIEASRNHPSGS